MSYGEPIGVLEGVDRGLDGGLRRGAVTSSGCARRLWGSGGEKAGLRGRTASPSQGEADQGVEEVGMGL